MASLFLVSALALPDALRVPRSRACLTRSVHLCRGPDFSLALCLWGIYAYRTL